MYFLTLNIKYQTLNKTLFFAVIISYFLNEKLFKGKTGKSIRFYCV